MPFLKQLQNELKATFVAPKFSVPLSSKRAVLTFQKKEHYFLRQRWRIIFKVWPLNKVISSSYLHPIKLNHYKSCWLISHHVECFRQLLDHLADLFCIMLNAFDSCWIISNIVGLFLILSINFRLNHFTTCWLNDFTT